MRRALAALALLAAPATAQTSDAALAARVERVLQRAPVIDGHNDLPWELREKYAGKVDGLERDSDQRAKPLMTDIARMRRGHVGGQFWSVWIPAATTGDEALRITLEQIDLVRRMCGAYPRDFAVAETAADVVRVNKSGRIACMIGMEGGHQIAGNLAAIRQFRALGVGYMTLTHSKNVPWADSATDDPVVGGLNAFGREVIAEMNRVGLIVDLSHVSPETMRAALDATKAPVIFSHSVARGLNDHPRNVPDDVLKRMPANGGVVMVNFFPIFLSDEVRRWSAARDAEEARGKALWQGQPGLRAQALADWDAGHPRPKVGIAAVADHIDYIVKLAGHDHVGLGGDLDGIPYAAEGLGGVDDYPALFVELARRGWSDADLAKLASGNVLRVMRAAEAVAAR